MAKILHLPVKQPSKFGFKRASKRKKDPEQLGQLNLFSSRKGRILHLPSRFTLFEEALLLDERDDPKAAELYREAIAADDCVADAYCNLGILESRAGSTDKAFDCFTKSLKQDPRHLEAHYNLGNLYFEMENLRLAQQHYEMAAEIDSSFPNIYFNLGLVQAIIEDFNAAVTALSKYKELVSTEEADKADELLNSLKRSLAVQH
ncbi:tetratricopeptide repeat protein [candidate division KSB1 bacterium]|nr:tetratricopeptide repeat protein [candidate division KSB1 bacterium]NIR72314.1 tetratricopeptide repeat protein [candidate division KSB1 bacterium]NIS26706.1 tetratricopeptide repeat protein [candidate division KSB1 bacterium]NIT70342.1 tetratricopeptide repeat protein [candidate division KSB1 bacterium]NIU27321.1 tetratricopeptide repeat protein [candidate division KSB1 bacterium]